MELDWSMIAYIFAVIEMAIIIAPCFAPKDFVIDATYIIGLEAINMALLVFWFHAIKTKPKEYVRIFLHKRALVPSFVVVFILVSISLLMGYFTALNILHSIVTLCTCTFTLFVNLFLIAINIMGQSSLD